MCQNSSSWTVHGTPRESSMEIMGAWEDGRGKRSLGYKSLESLLLTVTGPTEDR